MRILKFNSDYQECAHSFAYANKEGKGENYGNRMFYEDDTIFSYGYHFIIAQKIRDKFGDVQHVLFNNDTHSVTTSKQQYIVRRALFQKTIGVYSSISNFNAVKEIKEKEAEMLKLIRKYNRARAEHTKEDYLREIETELNDIKYLATYYRCKSKISIRIREYLKAETFEDVLKLLGTAEARKKRSDKRAEAIAEKKRLKRIEKQKREEAKMLEEWRNHEEPRIYLKHTQNDYLRLTQDRKKIETSQGVKIEVQEAKRLLKLIDNKKIIGAKIDDKFTVTAFNGALKVGCHQIPIEEINAIKEQIQ